MTRCSPLQISFSSQARGSPVLPILLRLLAQALRHRSVSTRQEMRRYMVHTLDIMRSYWSGEGWIPLPDMRRLDFSSNAPSMLLRVNAKFGFLFSAFDAKSAYVCVSKTLAPWALRCLSTSGRFKDLTSDSKSGPPEPRRECLCSREKDLSPCSELACENSA